MAEGRVNAQTQVLVDGTTEWRRVGDLPELSAALPSTPPLLASGSFAAASASGKLDVVDAPAIGLMIVGAMAFLTSVVSLLARLFSASIMPGGDFPNQAWVQAFAGSMGIVFSLLGMGISGIILLGGFKMKRLENYSLALTAAILALIPCTFPCCIVISLPIGIWALVILAKPEVKAAFP